MCCINIIYCVYTMNARAFGGSIYPQTKHFMFLAYRMLPIVQCKTIFHPCECIWNMFDKNWALPLEFLTFISTLGFYGIGMLLPCHANAKIVDVPNAIRHSHLPHTNLVAIYCCRSSLLVCRLFVWCQNFWFSKGIRNVDVILRSAFRFDSPQVLS